jgi:hypothetical protein
VKSILPQDGNIITRTSDSILFGAQRPLLKLVSPIMSDIPVVGETSMIAKSSTQDSTMMRTFEKANTRADTGVNRKRIRELVNVTALSAAKRARTETT